MDNETKVVPEAESGKAAENVIPEAESGNVTENIAPEAEAANAAKEIRCPNCQALLTEGQAFCPECGASVKKLCSNCGTELKENQLFCPSCGQRATGGAAPGMSPIDQYNQNIAQQGNAAKKKKKIICIGGAAAAAVILVLCLVFNFVNTQKKLKEYKDNAVLFCNTVLLAAGNLEDIGNEIQGEWHDYIYDRWSEYDSVDEAVAGALLNKSSEVSSAKTQKTTIDALYDKLKKPVNDSDEMEELCDAVKEFYDEYEAFYDLIIEPSGNYNSFTSSFGALDSSVSEAYNELNDLCDDLK